MKARHAASAAAGLYCVRLFTLFSFPLLIAGAAGAKPPPETVLRMLKDGNNRFVKGKAFHPRTDHERLAQAGRENQGDHAFATVLTCSDSRVPVERIFDAGVMDLFVVRVAGNVCNTDEVGSIEYGVVHVKTPVLVILGHTQCGAVTAVVNEAQGHGHALEANIPPLIKPIFGAVRRTMKHNPHLEGADLISAAIVENVHQSARDLFLKSPAVRRRAEDGEVLVIGAVYDVASGEVVWLPLAPLKEALAAANADPARVKMGLAQTRAAGLGRAAPAGNTVSAGHAHGRRLSTAAGMQALPRKSRRRTSRSRSAPTEITHSRVEEGGMSMLSTLGLFVLIIAVVGGGLIRYSTNRGLQIRLIAAFGVLLMIMVGLGVISYTSLSKIAKESEAVAQDEVPLLVHLTDVEKMILLETLELERYTQTRDEVTLQRYHELNESAKEEAGDVEELLETAIRRAPNAQARAELEAVQSNFSTVLDEYADFEETGRRLIAAIAANQPQLVHDLEQLMLEEEERMIESLTKAVEEMEKETIREAEDAASQATSTEMVVLIVCTLSVIAGVVLALFMGSSISGPIRTVIAGLRSGSDQVSSASEQLASSSQQMSEGASEQASSLEEVSSSLEEMASMTKQNADNAKQANAMAAEANTAAGQSSDAMRQMAQAVDRIKTSSEETAKIIKTIDEIAMQTNLLALNAAVEAARAGDAGRGFAVVAEEVRNLAQRSAEAAKNTANLIEGSQKSSESGVAATEEVGKTLEQITDRIQKVAQLISEVSAASDEQSQGIDQVNSAVAQMDRVTQGNAASAEESASASEELSGQAQALNGMVIELVNIVGEGRNGSATGSNAFGHGAEGFAATRSGKHSVSERVHNLLHHEGYDGGNSRPNKSKVIVRQTTPKQSMTLHAPGASAEKVIPLDDDEELRDF
ncbi:MAG: hypothetical protein GF331_10380 [Chitinivibrionales bacterium]|nr:hypothetical protein [Chitinivibrionales bacterium]